MARPPRFDFSGLFHHVMLRGNQGNFIFKDNSDFKVYLNLLGRARKEKDFKLLAYCLMSNHIHLLLKTGAVHLSKIMQWLGTKYPRYFNKKYEVSGHVFQGRYKNILVEKDAYLVEVSRYIHLNPVMAGLTARPEDYTWSSYPEYVGIENKNHVDKEEILDEFSTGHDEAWKKYRKFVEEKITEGAGEYPGELIKQVIIGSKSFAGSMLKKFQEVKGISQKKETPVSKENVIRYIEEKFGVALDALKNGSKNRKISEIRQILVYLLRERVRMETVEIRELLNLDVSTVSRNCQKIYDGIKNGNKTALEAVEYFS